MQVLGHPKLVSRLIDSIAQRGPCPFFQFMQQALYAPGLGYYSSGQQKFGQDGDFVTAPERSSLFSRCVARQCQQVLSALKQPVILEFGAGSGTMAVDILLALEIENALPNAYWILELSAELQARQRQAFKERAPHLLPRVQWLTRYPSTPFAGVVLANEVLDSMPVHKFRYHQSQLQQAFVDYQNKEFTWYWQPCEASVYQAVQKLGIAFAPNYESEINPLLTSWFRTVSSSLEQGTVLIMDYGYPRHEYYHPDRSMGTLMCYYQHRAYDQPLIRVGWQDITAHVDFTAVALAAEENHFEVTAFSEQAAFLLDCGITDWITECSPYQRIQQISEVKQLLLPGQMGAPFKVLALSKQLPLPLIGFRSSNQIGRL